jgi:hypothetical protein
VKKAECRESDHNEHRDCQCDDRFLESVVTHTCLHLTLTTFGSSTARSCPTGCSFECPDEPDQKTDDGWHQERNVREVRNDSNDPDSARTAVRNLPGLRYEWADCVEQHPTHREDNPSDDANGYALDVTHGAILLPRRQPG